MIIRIATEGQYEIAGAALSELDAADNALLDSIQASDPTAFRHELERVVSFVRSRGRRLGDHELRESELILPPPDTSLEEARALFAQYPRDLT